MNREQPAVVLDRLTRRYGAVAAVDGVTLEIGDGTFFTLLGPSGSGKTTCLRLVGGFEIPDSGRVLLHGQDVTDRPPYLRDVNTVFQDYALFPHMSVGENVAYGLMIRGVAPKERMRRAGEALELVRLPGLDARRPAQLSGGQRQRVALARALVNRPRVLLLDEPLGALDQKLRVEMQGELKALQRHVGITFLSVTHDQEEALSMSDRIAVFRRGRVEQTGSPADIYDRPASAFVAGFVGLTNLVPAAAGAALGAGAGDHVVRPEAIRLCGPDAPPPGWITLEARLDTTSYLGAFRKHSFTCVIAGRELSLTVVQPQSPAGEAAPLQPGDRVRLAWPRERMHPVPPAESGAA